MADCGRERFAISALLLDMTGTADDLSTPCRSAPHPAPARPPVGRFGREDAGMSWLRAGSRRRKPEVT